MSRPVPLPPATRVTTAAGRAPSASPLRRILHIDMDAYFASVEQVDQPHLKGKPVAVGGDPDRRGVVSAASYEARAHGVRSAMSMRRAVSLCPQLVIVAPRMGRYLEVSRRIREILLRFAPLVEMASLDEAYLDVTDCPGRATEIAARIKEEIRRQTGLTASAGAGPSKLVAKIASDMGKPDGLMVVRPSQVASFLAPLPVGRLWGVGPVTEKKLNGLGYRTLGELARAGESRMSARLGSTGSQLVRMARGEDDRPVRSRLKTRSISCERTLAEDTRDPAILGSLIERFASELDSSLRQEGLLARTLVLKVRYADFSQATRSLTLRSPFEGAERISEAGRRLLGRTQAGRRKVRLLGLGASGLIEAGQAYQPSLFAT